MSRLPLIQYWHEENPPDYIVALLDTFKRQNPEMQHLVFSKAGAEGFIAEHHGPRELAAFRSCAVPAMQADYFRYCAAHSLGGICVDVDYHCVSPLQSMMEEGAEGRLFGKGPLLINSLFGFRSPGHPLVGLTLDIVTQLIEQRFSGRVAGVTGPAIFTILYHLHQGLVESHEELRAERTRETGLPARLRDLTASIAGAISDEERLAQAFEGVRVSWSPSIQRWIRRPDARMAYKDTADDWRRAGLDIYR